MKHYILSIFLAAMLFSGALGAMNMEGKIISFRLDDVQDYFNRAAQIAIINLFKEEKVPLSIGVIANFFGTDFGLINFLKMTLAEGHDIEVTSHGYNHESFPTFSLEEQKTLLKDSKTKIMQYLAPYVPDIKVFIPPFNEIDVNTLTALEEEGYTHVSSQITFDAPPYPMEGQKVYRFPIGAATAKWNPYPSSEQVPHTETWRDIESQVTIFGFSVVMMHPEEFSHDDNSVDENHLNELREIIKLAKASGATLRAIGSINAGVVQTSEPSSSSDDTAVSSDESSSDVSSSKEETSEEQTSQPATSVVVETSEDQKTSQPETSDESSDESSESSKDIETDGSALASFSISLLGILASFLYATNTL